jgi:hypothetical protein
MIAPSEGDGVIAVSSVRVDEALDHVDLRSVRRRFSDLFDRAARAVHSMGLDLDDVVVDRLLTCATTWGGEWTVSAESLSDPQRFRDALVSSLSRQCGKCVSAAEVRIRGLTARVRRE